jgi:diaminohydroxyphosphoribosylaminopyrimidine deaminase / 5-amino-6-(5-phosphoribosylamino)uracil reductase
VLVVVSQGADSARANALREAGAETVVADSIDAALSDLGRRGITSLFLEGGKVLATAFISSDAIDRARVFVAPILLAGGERIEAVGPDADDTLIDTRFKEW